MQVEKSQRNEAVSLKKNLDTLLEQAKAERDTLREREQGVLRERNQMSSQLAELEKLNANLQCELDSQQRLAS